MKASALREQPEARHLGWHAGEWWLRRLSLPIQSVASTHSRLDLGIRTCSYW